MAKGSLSRCFPKTDSTLTSSQMRAQPCNYAGATALPSAASPLAGQSISVNLHNLLCLLPSDLHPDPDVRQKDLPSAGLWVVKHSGGPRGSVYSSVLPVFLLPILPSPFSNIVFSFLPFSFHPNSLQPFFLFPSLSSFPTLLSSLSSFVFSSNNGQITLQQLGNHD